VGNTAHVQIRNKARQHVRELLKNYNLLKSENEALREMIMNPHRESDDNIGGGKSSVAMFEVEEKAIKLASHEQIKFRSIALAVIDKVLAESSDHAQRIIELKYFSNEPKSWVAVAHEIEGYSEDGCRKIEKRVVDRIAQRLGW